MAEFAHGSRFLRFWQSRCQWYNLLSGEVSELADEHDLGSCAARRAGSSPAFPMWAGAERFGDGGERFGDGGERFGDGGEQRALLG